MVEIIYIAVVWIP